MVHGGLRYLAAGNWKLTRESLRERERLLSEAPGLIERIDYYFTLIRGQFPGRWSFSILLKLYDLFAGIKDHRFISAESLKNVFPGINIPGLYGAYQFSDAMTNDSRLVMRVLQEGMKDGGHALNYVSVINLLRENEHVCGVQVEEVNSSKKILIRASAIVNATGAWAGKLQDQIKPAFKIRPLRGSHLVIPSRLLPIKDVLTFFHPKDRRSVFVYPWEGTTVIGTTDLDHSLDLDTEASISQDELVYLLAAFNSQFPENSICEEDIISTWAGVRPIISGDKESAPSSERRDHSIWSNSGLITVSGGKLTTFRLIAKEVMRTLQKYLPKGPVGKDEHVFKNIKMDANQLLSDSPDLAKKLISRYGIASLELVNNMPTEELKPISNALYCMAECRWIARHESIQHLDDLLLRRTALGLILSDYGAEVFPYLQLICRDELGWNQRKWLYEVDRYKDICYQHYGVPEKSHASAA